MINFEVILPMALFAVPAIVILLACSAFLSGSETAFTGVSKARMHQLAKDGDKRAKWMNTLLEQRELVIASLLIGNNAVNILASSLATALFVRMQGDEFGVIIATLVMTFLVVVFAEVLPKFFAIRNADSIALRVARTLRYYVAILRPLAGLFPHNIQSDKNRGEAEKVAALQEVRGMIEIHHKTGDVVKDERDMLRGILDLKQLDVSAVMIHRKNVTMIDISSSSEALIDSINNAEYSRMPVYEGDPDNIIGILQIRQIRHSIRSKEKLEINSDIIRETLAKPWFVPDTAPLDKQLRAFLKKRTHFAVVVDEYGSIQGIITLSDILEEVFGDIDEDDEVDEYITVISDTSVRCDGQTPVRDLNRRMDWNLPFDEAATIAGLVISRAQNLPQESFTLNIGNYHIEVKERSNNRIKSLIISQLN